MKFKKIYFIYILAIFLLLPTFVNAADIMKLYEIQPGMKGTARTVFHGTRVEEFPVQILDIVEDQGLNKSLILFKASGDKIDEVGGIAAGMSGSPVYIDGKLIGAIGYGWSLSDHRYGLITPIEDMLKLLHEKKAVKQNDVKSNFISSDTPLFISGMSGRAYKRMKTGFESKGFEVLQGGGVSSSGTDSEPLQPGSAIAVQLVRGDINVASIGTLTYKDNDKILAFGHPFYNKGNVEYLLSKAYINGIIPSIQNPFKLASATDELLGTINNDRGAGIAGKLNQFPKIIPMSVRVHDIDRDKTNVVNVQMVKEESLLTSLMTNVSLQSLDSTLDRIGKGTAKVKFKITGKGLPDLGIERENVFYSRDDIAAVSLYEFYNLINVINTNPFEKVDLIDIKLDVEVADTDNVALVQEAKVLNETIKPGDKLEVEVTLHPYRTESFVKTVYIDIPEDMSPGTATLIIDGGLTGQSYQPIPEADTQQTEENQNQAIIEGYKDLESILNDYLESPKNNELIVQVFPGYPGAVYPPAEEAGGENPPVDEKVDNKEVSEPDKDSTTSLTENDEDSEEEIKELFPTDYVLEGSLSLDINIEGDNSTETNQGTSTEGESTENAKVENDTPTDNDSSSN